MAQKVQYLLVDDVDGGEADETVTFAVDGVSYEIDLNAENAESLRESFATWIGHGRRVGGRAARGTARVNGTRRSAKAASASLDLGEVRAWARANNYQVSDRGRISGGLMAAYEAAH